MRVNEELTAPLGLQERRLKVKVLKLTHIENEEGTGASCTYDAANCSALLEEITQMQYCEVGEEWKITVEEMSRGEFDALPEFIGW